LRNRNQRAENGVQNATLWRARLEVEKTVVADIEFDEENQLIAPVDGTTPRPNVTLKTQPVGYSSAVR